MKPNRSKWPAARNGAPGNIATGTDGSVVRYDDRTGEIEIRGELASRLKRLSRQSGRSVDTLINECIGLGMLGRKGGAR